MAGYEGIYRNSGWLLAALLVVAASCSSSQPRGEPVTSASARSTVSPSSGAPVESPTETQVSWFQPLGVAFWNARHGLVTGQLRCRGCDGHNRGIVFATRDGGRSWNVAFEGGGSAEAVTTNGTGRALVGVGSRLLQTSEGGRRWRTLGHSQIHGLSFVSRDLGWGVRPGTLPGHLVKTSDGGQHWRAVKDPCGPLTHFLGPTGWGRSSANYLADVWFATPDRGWALCGGDGAMGSAPVAVYETADGGGTWTEQEASWDAEPGGLQFFSDGKGWRWPYGSGPILQSRDGGATWRRGGGPVDLLGPANSVWFASSNVGYAIADRSLYRSIDGGKNWTVATPRFTP